MNCPVGDWDESFGQSMSDPYSLNLVNSELKVRTASRGIVRSWGSKKTCSVGRRYIR